MLGSCTSQILWYPGGYRLAVGDRHHPRISELYGIEEQIRGQAPNMQGGARESIQRRANRGYSLELRRITRNRIRMYTIYLDHNIVHYHVMGFPQGTDASAETASLTMALARQPDLRFVVSDWNVVEAARECARSSDGHRRANRYASFLKRLNPVFIEGHDTLQRAELMDLALAYWGMHNTARAVDWMFASHFSQVASSRVKEVLVGFDVRIYLRHLIKNPASLAEFDEPVATARQAIRIGIDAYNSGDLKDGPLRARIDRDWLLSLLPERNQDGKWIDLATRQQLADTWSSCSEHVIRQCPTLAVESALAELRAAAGGRKPRDSDAFDLMHAVPALAYCGAFITNDKHLRGQAAAVADKARRSVVLASRLSEAIDILKARTEIGVGLA